MKNGKKILFVVLAAALLLTAALPALADNQKNAPQMGLQASGGRGGQMNGGRGGRQMMPGMQAPNTQTPDAGNRTAPSQPADGSQTPNAKQPKGLKGGRGQIPQAPATGDGQTQDDANSGATPAQPGMPHGRKGGRGFGSFEAMLKDGVISQETYDAIVNAKKTSRFDKLLEEGTITKEEYDAIQKYLESKNPAAQSTVPAAPEAPAEGELPPEPPTDELDPVLSGLVESGVITQEQADAIQAARSAAPEEPAEAVDETAPAIAETEEAA